MKIFMIVLCALLGLAGLFMSACGGFFSLMSLGDSGTGGILAISLPFMAVGAACLWGAIAGIRRLTRKPPSGTDQR